MYTEMTGWGWNLMKLNTCEHNETKPLLSLGVHKVPTRAPGKVW
jgi:hypothetical protein